jgi:RNA:NAD 2'-phosphotransferase (TPT1/KptA family)
VTDVVRVGERLSYVLRHHPDSVAPTVVDLGHAPVVARTTRCGWSTPCHLTRL